MTCRFTPFLVRAHLAAGVAHATPWGISLDGLLASELWANRKATALDRGDPVEALRPDVAPGDLDLPLHRCTLDPREWHWSATFAFPEDPVEDPVIRYWTTRTDHRGVEELASWMPAVVSDRQGRYRARYMPLMVTNTRTVVWRGVGDVDAVAGLLDGLDVIGKKRATGEGRVLRWKFEPTPDKDTWTTGHLHPDGSLGRTAPPGCFAGTTIPRTRGFGLAGIRPPYMHPARMRDLHLPR